MLLVSRILGLPLAPMRGVIKLGGLFQQQAEQQLYGSGQVRRQLEELGEALEAGEITPEEERRAARELLGRVVETPAVSQPGTSGPGTSGPGTSGPGTSRRRTGRRRTSRPGTGEPGREER